MEHKDQDKLRDYEILKNQASNLHYYRDYIRAQEEKRDKIIDNIQEAQEQAASIEAGMREMIVKLDLGSAA